MGHSLIYIAGPMTGKDNYEEDFYEAEHLLEERGWRVINPCRLDAEAGIDPVDGCPYSYTDAALRDLRALDSADAIYLLKDWESSKGACWEWAYCKKNGKRIYYAVPRPPEELDCSGGVYPDSGEGTPVDPDAWRRWIWPVPYPTQTEWPYYVHAESIPAEVAQDLSGEKSPWVSDSYYPFTVLQEFDPAELGAWYDQYRIDVETWIAERCCDLYNRSKGRTEPDGADEPDRRSDPRQTMEGDCS